MQADGKGVGGGDAECGGKRQDGFQDAAADDGDFHTARLQGGDGFFGAGYGAVEVLLGDVGKVALARADEGKAFAIDGFERHFAVHRTVGKRADLCGNAGECGQLVDAFEGGEGGIAVKDDAVVGLGHGRFLLGFQGVCRLAPPAGAREMRL